MKKIVYLCSRTTGADDLPPPGGLNEKITYGIVPGGDINAELNGALSGSMKELSHVLDLKFLPYVRYWLSNFWKETPQGVDRQGATPPGATDLTISKR